MSGKPNSRSVTRVACRCGFLERLAAEPNDVVVFDQETSEYHIIRPRGGYVVAYHCPSCGGAAPRSKRHELFATITHAEAGRLEKLTSGIGTVEEALAALGKPDRDDARGLTIHTPGKDKAPPRVASYRVLTFRRLSEAADVLLTDYGVHGIRFTYQGKSLGKSRRAPTKPRRPKPSSQRARARARP